MTSMNSMPANLGQRSQARADGVNLSAHATRLARDVGASLGRSRFGRLVGQCTRGLLRALHESRRLDSERVIARHRHLVADADQATK
jgi:hypothetical protein